MKLPVIIPVYKEINAMGEMVLQIDHFPFRRCSKNGHD